MAVATRVHIAMRARWSEELVSEVNRLTYDFDSFTGELFMPPGCNCDGAIIDLYKRIDPKVRLIRTYAGGLLDTVYRRERQDWKAYLPKHKPKEAIK